MLHVCTEAPADALRGVAAHQQNPVLFDVRIALECDHARTVSRASLAIKDRRYRSIQVQQLFRGVVTADKFNYVYESKNCIPRLAAKAFL